MGRDGDLKMFQMEGSKQLAVEVVGWGHPLQFSLYKIYRSARKHALDRHSQAWGESICHNDDLS